MGRFLLRSKGTGLLIFVLAIFLPGGGSFWAQSVNLEVLGVEVTQAIQEFHLYDPSHPGNNSVELVAGNHTTARVFARTSSLDPISGVGVSLSVFVNGVPRPIFTPPFPGSYTLEGFPDREDENASINFLLPPDVLPGDVMKLVVELDPLNEIDEWDETDNIHVVKGLQFKGGKTPDIAYIPINYQSDTEPDASTIGLPEHSLIRPGEGDDFVFATYPFPDKRSRYHQLPSNSLNWMQNIDDPGASTALLETLELLRQGTNPMPDFLYGWFRGNPYDGNGGAWLSGRVSFGNTQDSPTRYQKTFAHELGHNFGRDHEFELLVPDVGWDVNNLLGMGRVKDSLLVDFMYPTVTTEEGWVARETYQALMANPILDCELDCDAEFTETPLVFVTVTATPGEGRFKEAWSFPRRVASTVDNPIGNVMLRALDKEGGTLDEVRVLAPLREEGGDSPRSLPIAVTFSGQITADSIQTIQLIEGLTISDAIERTAYKPEVRINSPIPGQTLEGEFQVSWQAHDADEDSLTYLVQYSWGFDRDGQRLWVPLGANLESNTVVADTKDLAASTSATIRIVATDGFNSSMAEVSGLYVPGENSPSVYIANLEEVGDQLEGSLLILEAAGYDREDGYLPDASFEWVSNLDGLLGQGPTLQTATLSPGEHRITVAGIDDEGKRSEASVNIRVVPNSFARSLRAAEEKSNEKDF